MKFAMATLVAVVSLFCSLPAVSAEVVDLKTRIGRYYTSIVVNEDGTAVESAEWSKTVLKEAAIENVKHASIGFSTSAQKGDIVAAYTLKADGRRLEVPKDNYQIEVNKGSGKDSPVYSDRTTISVVFPDVSVGDTVVLSYRIAQTEPMFPKHFSTAYTYYNQTAYDDVRLQIDWPAGLWVQYDARDMTEAKNATKDGRRVMEWRYSNPEPKRTDRKDFSVFDPEKEAGLSFSTFKTYTDITSAYGARALPKAVPDERIKALAATIVGDKTARKDQARALYDWVATHITYIDNRIGIGAVVPRDLSFVIDNKMGDCKDHATLLQALLAARGIAATQALVNSGSVYRLPRIPVVSMVNHVINYLPEFDLYVDSTAGDTPFGMLPMQVQDKPVLLVEGYRDGTRTPVAPVGSNREQTRVALRIDANGEMAGTIEVTQQGRRAVSTRAWARNMTKDVQDDLIKNMLRSKGLTGSGKLEKDDPTDLTDSYHYKVTLNAEKYLRLPGAGAFHITPPFGIGSSMAKVLASSGRPAPEVDVVCSNVHATEDYSIELPEKMKVLSIPENLTIDSDIMSYTATYELDKNVLKVHRVLDDRTKGNVCTPKTITEFKALAEKAMDNLKEQVLYK